MNNYANYLYIAIRAALDAGKAIMDIYTDPESDFGIERKADNSPLTKADKKAHAIISMALSVTPFPVLSEEGKEKPFAERSGWDMLWIVDPLDGTKEYLRQLERSQRVSREIQLFPHGHVDHAQYRNPFLHKGDINRKFAVFLDKLLRPVQRVDDPEHVPA